MEFAITNPFVPRASIIRFPNGVFEMRIHTHGICSAVEVVPHDNYVLVTGRMIPRARRDFFGHPSALVWSDNSCGYFSRDIPIRLSPGTRIVILERRQDCDDLVIRYTLRNNYAPLSNCGNAAQFDGYSSRPYSGCSGCGGQNTFYGEGFNQNWGGYGGPGLNGNHHCDKGVNCSCKLGPFGASFNAGVHYDVGGGIQASMNRGVPSGVGVPAGAPQVGVSVQEGFATQPLV